MDIEIILPAVSDEPVADMLRAITEAIVLRDEKKWVGGFLGGHFGYGAEWNSDVFLMHPYCWCETEDCPWCGGCFCPSNTWRDEPSKYLEGDKCAWCRGVHRHAEYGALPPDEHPHYGAPNFWHKSSGLRIWWYKYIGRDMQVVGDAPPNLTPLFRECLEDVAAQGTEARSDETACGLGPKDDGPVPDRGCALTPSPSSPPLTNTGEQS